MRIGKLVGGPEKPVLKEAAVEAQRDDGRRQRPVCVAAIMLAAAIVAIVASLAVITYCTDIKFLQLCGTDGPEYIPEEVAQPVEDGAERRITPHSSWSLRPQRPTHELVHPTPYVLLKHTAGGRCFGVDQCTPLLRAIQELHYQVYDQPEISYNFLIDSDGQIYEGRGWNNTNPSKGFAMRCNVDVALIGNYVEHYLTKKMLLALRWLLEEGMATGMLATDYRLVAHNQVKNTLSPGRRALVEIADWPHRCLEDCDWGARCVRSSAAGNQAGSSS